MSLVLSDVQILPVGPKVLQPSHPYKIIAPYGEMRVGPYTTNKLLVWIC